LFAFRVPRVQDIRIDGWVLGFALLLSVGAGVVFGVAPGFFAAGTDVQGSLKEAAGHTEKAACSDARGIPLAVAEVAWRYGAAGRGGLAHSKFRGRLRRSIRDLTRMHLLNGRGVATTI